MRAIGALPLLWTTACAGPPTGRLTWRESWEFISLTSRGHVVDGRVTVGNTGVLRGQGHLRLDRWMESGAPIRYHRTSAPGETGVFPDRERVRIGDDLLDLERHTWSLNVNADEANAVLHLAPTSRLKVPPVSALVGPGQWTVTASVPAGRTTGWIEAGERGGNLEGRGTLLYRGGDGLPRGPRRTLILQGGDASIGFDSHGSMTLAWVHLDGQALNAQGADLVETQDGWMLNLPGADVTALLTRRPVAGEAPLHPDASPLDTLGMSMLGMGSIRSVQALQASVVRPGSTQVVPGVLIQVAEEDEHIVIRGRGGGDR